MTFVITTASGRNIDLSNPEKHIKDIKIEDIIIALSHEIRWGGHSPYPLSVLTHSLAVESHLFRLGKSHILRFTGLMCNVPEAYLKNIPQPIIDYLNKHGNNCYKYLMNRWHMLLSIQFGYVYPFPDIVMDADTECRRMERQRFDRYNEKDGSDIRLYRFVQGIRQSRKLFASKYDELVRNINYEKAQRIIEQ